VSNGIWLFIILILTVCCGFTSFKSYNEWNSQPVITTVSSTGYPISKVQFPSGVDVFKLFSLSLMLETNKFKGSLRKAFSIKYTLWQDVQEVTFREKHGRNTYRFACLG
jgi:hypothetical protein